MDHVRIIEAAHDIQNGIGFADMGEKLITQTFAFTCARHEARNVHKLGGRRQDFLRFDDGGKRSKAWVGNFNDSDVGFNRAERIVLGRDTRLGQGIEEGGLAHIGQPDNAASQTHKNVLIWRARPYPRRPPPSIQGNRALRRRVLVRCRSGHSL